MGCKTFGGDFFYLSRVLFPFSLNRPQADPFFCLFFFFFFFYLLVEWQGVTKRFQQSGWASKEAKGVVLVRGSWHMLPCSTRLPFDMNQCDAPNSAPDGVSSEGVTLRDCVELGLFNLYLPFSQIKKKHLHLHYKYHRSGIHVLYAESPYFSIYKTYTYSKNTEIAKAVR